MDTSKFKKGALRYALSILAAVAALAVSRVFRHPFLDLAPFLVFYAAVAISSWFGGTGPGLVAIAFGTLTAILYLYPGTGAVRFSEPEGISRVCVFIAIGVLIACLNGALRRSHERCDQERLIARRAEDEVRQQQARLQEMSAQLMMAEERERRRIATVLHDSVVQMLALSKMKVDRLRRASNNGAVPKLNEVYDLIDKSIAHTRNLMTDLSPPVLYELGLTPALQWLGDRLREEHGISFSLTTDSPRYPLTEESRLVIFQAVRELIVNVVKHARASRCAVALSRDADTIQVVVKDNGRGFVEHTASDFTHGGFGLFNIRQRLAHLGGRFDIEFKEGSGTIATICAPLAAEERMTTHEHATFAGR